MTSLSSLSTPFKLSLLSALTIGAYSVFASYKRQLPKEQKNMTKTEKAFLTIIIELAGHVERLEAHVADLTKRPTQSEIDSWKADSEKWKAAARDWESRAQAAKAEIETLRAGSKPAKAKR